MKRIADEAQFDLNKVMPAMMEAEKAVRETFPPWAQRFGRSRSARKDAIPDPFQ